MQLTLYTVPDEGFSVVLTLGGGQPPSVSLKIHYRSHELAVQAESQFFFNWFEENLSDKPQLNESSILLANIQDLKSLLCDLKNEGILHSDWQTRVTDEARQALNQHFPGILPATVMRAPLDVSVMRLSSQSTLVTAILDRTAAVRRGADEVEARARGEHPASIAEIAGPLATLTSEVAALVQILTRNQGSAASTGPDSAVPPPPTSPPVPSPRS